MGVTAEVDIDDDVGGRCRARPPVHHRSSEFLSLTSRLRGQLLVENFGCSFAMLPQDPVSAIDSAGTRSERFVRESEEPSSQRP